ncbi:putative phosphodiesterase/alkaline phosphatase D [Erythrobacter litoralis HTCC2594]|uniref:Putative phosphodiesterase/alkaline phosphatase D n=2 Tax=Erythrobacter litoralis TaxID=39960 RepID=Q2NCN7_ERYLH|nr:putative phosphodiesterase/alkaline phosphatase D [Erythrobacter litoralis HTCC2594]
MRDLMKDKGHTMRSLLAAIPLALAAPLAAQGATVDAAPSDFLEGYYAKLRQDITLPAAPVGVPLPSTAATLTRIAFGSCNHQSRSQHMWAQIAATDPDLFLFIGDNNYGDQGWAGDAALTTLREAYAVQAETPELAAFRGQVPMMVTWDDHDYGFNDGGGSFAFKTWSETLFETFWDSTAEVKSRPGIYESRIFGPSDRRTQIIMLDTRFFRSELERMEYQDERPPLGPYVQSDDPSKTMLGEAQWAWLEQELAKPADLRIIVSSIQVLTDAHDYESWEALPLERRKLYEMVGQREDSGVVFLSGDRHAGGIYADTPLSAGEQLWELTSSSLNYSFSSTEANTAREPDPRRLTDFISEENFGLVEIDWDAETVTLSLRGSEGEVRVSETMNWGAPVSDAPMIMEESGSGAG